MSDRRIILTGATGFIGRPLAAELRAAGYETIVLTRDARKAAPPSDPDLRLITWDGRTAEGWGPLADGARAIINLAGDNLAEGRWTRAKKSRILNSRTAAGAAVVEAVRSARAKPAVVIQASAVGFYGSRGGQELDERSAGGHGFLAGVVGSWEASTREVEAFGVRRVIIRSGLVLGRSGGAFPSLVRPFRFFTGGPLGSGRQWLSWIHLADEVRAIRFLVEREDLAGVHNLTAPDPLPEKDLCRELGAALGRPCWFPVPAFLLKVLFGEKATETLLCSQRVLPLRLRAAGFEFRFPETGAALRDLVGR